MWVDGFLINPIATYSKYNSGAIVCSDFTNRGTPRIDISFCCVSPHVNNAYVRGGQMFFFYYFVVDVLKYEFFPLMRVSHGVVLLYYCDGARQIRFRRSAVDGEGPSAAGCNASSGQ